MSEQIQKSFKELVDLKFQLYNSLFLTLPLDAVEQTGLLLPLMNESCVVGFEKGQSPVVIIDDFFNEHKPNFKENDKISFLFKVIQYVERQIVLIDALEEAAFAKIHNINDSNRWEQIYTKVKNRNSESLLKELFADFSLRLVLTAHPTQFYPGKVLAISTDLTEAIKHGDVAYARDLLMQLGKTQFYRKTKPSAYDEAISLTWYLGNIFYPAIGELLDKLSQTFKFELSNKLVSLGFWPGGDRDGNPFVTVDTTRKVATHLRYTLTTCYSQELKELKRRLSFDGILNILIDLDRLLEDELTHLDGSKNVDLNFFLEQLEDIEYQLIEYHQNLFLDKLRSFIRKVKLFGFHFASIDVRQDSRVIKRVFDELLGKYKGILPSNYIHLPVEEQLNSLLDIDFSIENLVFDEEVVQDTLDSFKVISEIQEKNGVDGAHRYIISNCRGVFDIARVMALARLSSFGNHELTLDIVPLFETIDDLKQAGETMNILYNNNRYKSHLKSRGHKQTVMLGFSDGTKDGGYFMANWSIYRAKEDITKVSRQNGISVQFFDGRGGPPARGGGNAHLFYSAMGKEIESKQIQMTVQGQTISSHYGIKEAAVHNLGHLLSAGLENNLFNRAAAHLNITQRTLIDELSKTSFQKYQALKNHELFLPFLEERSTLKYYSMANIGSRPSKRGTDNKLRFEDLRAIPFVGAWSQLKQNVPGFYGVGTALKQQNDKGNLDECKELYKSSIFFKTLISNSMQSMSKTNFVITKYMQNDEKFGEFWKTIHDEFILTKEMVLKVSELSDLLEDNPRSKMSISLREKVVLPLLTIQQYALIEIQKVQQSGDKKFLKKYERMVMRSLFGNINASRNSV